MKINFRSLLFTAILFVTAAPVLKAQCTDFDIISYDNFEDTLVRPQIVPGTVYHYKPQTYAARSGTRSLYLNLANCAGGAGTCAGDSFYVYTLNCCPTQPIRFRWWMQTVFGAPLSDIRVVLYDGNDNILADVPSTIAPNAQWTEFISPAVIPGTFAVKLVLYTNIDGGNGNDLGIDDLYVEKCANGTTSSQPICAGVNAVDLIASVPNNPVNSGTWSGPTALTNGYLGTYTAGVNSPGTYVYTSTPYGSSGLCAVVNDTVIVSNNAGTSPAPHLGNDTTLCLNNYVVLIAGINGTGNTFLWNTGATTFNITQTSAVPVSNTYSVTVTASNGCKGRDTIVVTWQTCSGLNETDRSGEVTVYPNPARNQLTVQLSPDMHGENQFILFSPEGKEVLRTSLPDELGISLPPLADGIYIYTVQAENGRSARGRVSIRN